MSWYNSANYGRFDRGTTTVKENFSKNVTIMTVISDSIANKVIDNIFETMTSSDGRILFMT
jgi:nitrogen regulatory protein PII